MVQYNTIIVLPRYSITNKDPKSPFLDLRILISLYRLYLLIGSGVSLCLARWLMMGLANLPHQAYARARGGE